LPKKSGSPGISVIKPFCTRITRKKRIFTEEPTKKKIFHLRALRVSAVKSSDGEMPEMKKSAKIRPIRVIRVPVLR
jgi:hypothetical protein